MKFKKKMIATASVALAATMIPVNALAAVRVNIYGDRRVYGTETPFDTYVDLTSTGVGLIKNTATLELMLSNGKFAKDSSGNYYPIYITDLKGENDREDIAQKLEDGSAYGFGFLPEDDDSAKLVLPENMIDKYAQIMFTATAVDYGDVTLSLSDNRGIEYIVDSEDDAKEIVKEREPEKTIVKIPVGSNIIYIGDEQVELDVPAYISNNTVKVPLRAVTEIFGAEVYWNGAEKTVLLLIGDDEIEMRIGDKRMFVNGYAVPLSSAPEISNKRVFLPLKDISKILGIENMEWDDINKTVSFEYTDYVGHTYLTYEDNK